MAYDAECKDKDWIKFFDDELSAALFWKELLRIYPSAKFILTI